MWTRITLRLPKELHETLVAWAKAEDRSLNAMIVHLLRRAVSEWHS